MEAKVFLPDGKTLTFTKDKGGVEKLFFVEGKGLVVVSKSEVLTFANYPTTLSFERKESDIE